jgi:leucyl aminopeptidase
MEVIFEKSFDHRKKTDCLIIPFWKKGGVAEYASLEKGFKNLINPILDLGDFSGKERELSLIYPSSMLEQRALLVGFGEEEKCSIETIRKVFSEVARFALAKKLKRIQILVPFLIHIAPLEVIKATIESIMLTNYRFDYLSSSEEKIFLEETHLISQGHEMDLSELTSIVKGVNLARDLVNGNADEITPMRLVEESKKLEKNYSDIKLKVLDKEEIQKRGMGLFYAVARASCQDPYFIHLCYKGDSSSEEQIVLVGKGITYDTGGLSLKPSASMDTMKCDMAGAAATLGCLLAAAEMKMKVNLTVLIAATENSIGSKAYKLGDVYQGYSKKTVEIKNTDAEGRLALADCLAYAVDVIKPKIMIDLATLTGAALVALGDLRSPLFSTHEGLALDLYSSGEQVAERLWQMPLDPEYKEMLSSKIADIKNCGSREGSLIFSAMFLKEFVKDVPWAHIDIAGPAYLDKPRFYHTTSATGYGVRLLIHYLMKHHAK